MYEVTFVFSKGVSAGTQQPGTSAPMQHLPHLFGTYNTYSTCSAPTAALTMSTYSMFRAFSELCGKIWCVGTAKVIAAPTHQILPQSSEKALKMLDRC